MHRKRRRAAGVHAVRTGNRRPGVPAVRHPNRNLWPTRDVCLGKRHPETRVRLRRGMDPRQSRQPSVAVHRLPVSMPPKAPHSATQRAANMVAT